MNKFPCVSVTLPVKKTNGSLYFANIVLYRREKERESFLIASFVLKTHCQDNVSIVVPDFKLDDFSFVLNKN